jgi:hypothetical protein
MVDLGQAHIQRLKDLATIQARAHVVGNHCCFCIGRLVRRLRTIPHTTIDCSGHTPNLNMRFTFLAVLLLFGLALSAEFVHPNATEVNELLAGLAKLPTCAVCTILTISHWRRRC